MLQITTCITHGWEHKNKMIKNIIVENKYNQYTSRSFNSHYLFKFFFKLLNVFIIIYFIVLKHFKAIVMR